MRCSILATVVALFAVASTAFAAQPYKPLQAPNQNLRQAPIRIPNPVEVRPPVAPLREAPPTAPLREVPRVEVPRSAPLVEAPHAAPLMGPAPCMEDYAPCRKYPIQAPFQKGGPFQKPLKSCFQKPF